MKGFIKAVGFGMGFYAVALVFSLGAVYGIKTQKRVEDGNETAADNVTFSSIDYLDRSMDQLSEVYGK